MSDLRKPGAESRSCDRVTFLLTLALTPWRHYTAATARVWAFLLFGFTR